jgi:chromosome segregation ATPase
MHESQIRFEATVSELKDKLKNVLDENSNLRKAQEDSSGLGGKVENLEVDLQESEKQNDDLKAQLEVLLNEKAENLENVKQLEECISRLEANMLELEKQV